MLLEHSYSFTLKGRKKYTLKPKFTIKKYGLVFLEQLPLVGKDYQED